jgi:imidazolonepropionase-like amidohydrolase
MGGILTVAQMSTAKRALMGAAHGREMLEAGFTSVRDLGNSGVNGDVALRDAINAGWVIGPRIHASTRALAPAGGQFGPMVPEAQHLINLEYAVVNSPDQARAAVRQALYEGATWIKIIANQGRIRLSAAEVKAIMEEAENARRPVAAHTTDDETARLAVEAGVTSIEHGYILSDETLQLMAKKHVFLVPTDGPADSYVLGPQLTPEQRKQQEAGVKSFRERSQDRLRRAIKAGVPIAAGSDSYVQVPGKNRGQAAQGMFQAYAEAGMSAPDIIKAATINAAEMLGWHDRIGSLEAGRFADVIAVAGNPLQDISDLSKVQFVMKDGKIIKHLK